MSQQIQKRVSALRNFLEAKNLHAFIIPSSDIHQSEYPPAHWSGREWISGFSGSAGTVVVTRNEAGLWTDSRYFLQAEEELRGTGIDLFRDRLPQTPTIAQWLSSVLQNGDRVGVDGNVYSAKDVIALKRTLSPNGLEVNTEYDPFEVIWADRPFIPKNPVFEMPIEFSGVPVSAKINQINTALQTLGADGLLMASLDTLAWLFNLRGNDVPYNPVFVAFGYVSLKETVLFLYPEKLNQDIVAHLQQQGVVIAHYDKIFDYLATLKNVTVYLQSDRISYSLFQEVQRNNNIVDGISPADIFKSQKNESEIGGFRNAMIKDGVALVKFFRWLEDAVPKGDVTEYLVSRKLFEFRIQQQLFAGESFATIAGFQENGAIVHYHADEHRSKKISNEGLLLIDSGAQYFDGTTDITRTVALGALSSDMKQDYTLVLKGHIALASACFPAGTRGAQLDMLARQFMWQKGVNYLHGTGHGIGHFLNVHEGPQSIRMEENPVSLEPGMVLSNEPGIYRAGRYGIRIENLMVVQKNFTTDFGDFYHFQTLTLCPIDTAPLSLDMLSKDEINWLNAYHQGVFEALSPCLGEEEVEWLKIKTKELPDGSL